MQPMQILVLGPEGAGRSALESTLARLGCAVSVADASAGRPEPSAADVLMLDVRGDQSQWAGVARRLRDDDRPVMVVSESPNPIVRELSRRAAGTVLMCGAETDAGYRVALSVLQGLRGGALGGSADIPSDDTLTGMAAL